VAVIFWVGLSLISLEPISDLCVSPIIQQWMQMLWTTEEQFLWKFCKHVIRDVSILVVFNTVP
jgi:hypothetical protein